MNQAPAAKKIKKEYDFDLIWNIDTFSEIFPLIEGTLYQTRPAPPHLASDVLDIGEFIQRASLFARRYRTRSVLRSPSDILNSQAFTVQCKDIAMQWMMCLHREAQGNVSLIGIELHLMHSDKRAQGDCVIKIPINAQVSVIFLNMHGQEIYFGGTYSHTFQNPAKNSTGTNLVMTRPGGLVLLFNLQKIHGLLSSNNMGGELRLKLGLNIDNDDVVSTKDNLISNLSQLLISGDQSNFSIEVGSETFLVHKLILSMRCLYFASLFNSGMKVSENNKLIVPDMEPLVLKYVVEYIYTSRIAPNLGYEHLLGIIKTADLYQLNELKQICFGQILNFLDPVKAADLAVLALLHNAELKVRVTISDYISSRWAQLSRNPDFKELVRKHPDAFFTPN